MNVNEQEWFENKRAEMVQGLRDAADMLESCPLDMLPYSVDISIMVTEWDGNNNVDVEATQRNLAKATRWLRNAVKKYDEHYFTLRRDFGRSVKIEVNASRSSVCEKVKTGTRWVPAKMVDEFEYQCEKVSFLGMEEN